MLKKGEWVWLESSIGVSIGARVKVTKTGQQVLVDDEGKEHIVPQGGGAAIRVMHPTSVEGVEDMIRLGDLNEAGLLRNLMLRHKQSNIYTYTGSVLVAVNPYQELPLYTAEQVRLYHGRRLGELPPHVFAIADTCYFNMRRFKRNQCCIISGESGAGKTESTKLMLQFLAAVSGQHSWIEQQILEANPILEAFGNAKTIRNDNSSRFGKYVEIFFNKDGVIEGAKMEQYLLEKSRVCHQAIQERNYHIFYCMLAGMSEEQKKILSLGDTTDFNFLTQGDCIVCEGRDDAKDYARLRSALRILTFTDSQCWGIFTLLTALLHLGNINFKATILDNMEHSDISKSDHFTIAAKLLEVQSKALEVSLTQRSFLTNTERVSKPLSSEQALDCRDAFVKAIYGKLFIWIVGKINNTIHKILMNGPKYVRNSIGLLDIFGFENFDSNSFEQLCINFANEQLQQFFVNHMFKEEQDEYSKEEIVWKNVSFDDNQSTLDLLAGKSLNLLSLIDEESHFPKGTDATMLNKMNTVHGKSNIYLSSKSAHDVEFGIHHFAGVVYYNSKGFLEKNRDAVSSDIIKLIDMSTNKLLRMIFETELNSNRAKISNNQRVVITPKSSLRAHSDGRKQVTTLSGQFRTSLDALMKTLSVCQPFFIRCFKPNDDKQSKSFDRELCIRQLRYSGMMDTIRIRKLGFPIRHSFKDFLQRYRVLLNTTVCDPQTETAAACCDAICRAVITGDDGWRIGKTKIFLKDAHDSFLEQEREREFNRKALIIQRIMLGHRDRKSFVNKRRAAVVVQTYWRAYRVQKINRKILRGFERLISRVRGRKAQLEFQKKQKAAISMQARVRGSLARKSFKRQRQAVTLLQAHARGMLVRKKANKIRTATFLSAQEHQAQKQEALELQRRLEEVVRQSQQASSSPEPTDEEGIEDMFNFLPTVAAQAQPERPSSYVVEKKKEEENKEKDEEKQTELQEKQTELEKKIKPEQTETKPEEKETKQEEKETKLEEKETKLEEKETKQEEKEIKLEEKETKLEEKETKQEEKETKLEEKETKLEEKETKQEEKETKLEEKETKLEEKETKLEEKETKSKPEDKALLVTITEAPELDTVSDPSLQELPVEDYNSDDEEDHSADDEYSFFKFSAMHFQGSASNSHINQRLRQPLLHHEDEGDALACLTVWWIILRFMGDLPEPKNSSHECFNSISNSSPQYAMRQGRRLSHLVGLDQKVLRKNRRKSEVAGSNRKNSTVVEESENEVDGNDILIGEGPTLDRPLSSLDKLHVIVGYAISRPNIRDEIYCQICKQLIKNKNKRSRLRGWILMSICLGVFPPSERLLEYLESFIRRGHKSYGPYCAERLRRIVANGERREPPCYIELKAAKSKTPVLMSVSLMDGSSVSLTVDSASTSAELCGQVAEKINLKDTYGFSIYIDVYEKLWSLGSGGKHVMDAVCQCEQEVRRKGDEELPTLWKLSFQKELFSPWHDSMQDPVSTDIIYQQVIRGLKSKKYSSEKEDDFVQLAAMHYYAQFGSENSSENARKVMEDCIPIYLIETKSQTKWIQMINAAHIQSSHVKVKESKEKAKADVVDSARQKWPIYFSKFYEVTMISGPSLPKSSFIAAINWKGVSFQDNKDKQLLELTYPTVNAANIASDGITGSQSLSLDTMQGLYLLRCNLAGEMAELIQMYLDGLKEHSVYAVALQDVNRPDDPTFLSCKRGDLLVIVKDGEYSPEHIWIKGTNERTANTGAITTDAIQVLPTLAKPNEDILKLFSLNQDQKKTKNILEKDDTVAPVSLKEFSFEYFRQPGKEAGRPGQVKRKEKLWVISREPLKQPLLKSLEGNSDLSHMACTAFIAILKYMGDYPNKHIRSAIELTDQIFGPATQYVELQDEIYCQIMRQMTNNSNRISTDYGWQLMWLCTGLFPPSRALVKHTQHFLESRPREPLATDCLQRLQTMLSLEPRKLPPHQVEIDAIRQNSSQIFHKVHFPNETAELFEVESTTRIRDLCRTIASRLQLSSSEGFGLFMKTTNKVMGLNEHDYFFDSLRPTAEQPKKGKKSKEGTGASAPYLVLFMRKLWFNVTPGRDLIADLNFHFPQELPKYLRGYHKCTKEDVIRLAGLLFRVKVDTDKSQFVMIPRMLKELVPANQLKSMSPEEWKKHIISSYNKQAGITVDEAKVAFLRIISSWPTFGCAFFEVKQTSEPSYPSIVMIAISKQGVNFLDPKTKEFLVLYPFNRITNWSSGSTFFHMTVGNLVKGNNILCETSLGYKMDDLLTSYFNMYESQRMAVQPMTQMFKTQY